LVLLSSSCLTAATWAGKVHNYRHRSGTLQIVSKSHCSGSFKR
jgi:hypothetical protein